MTTANSDRNQGGSGMHVMSHTVPDKSLVPWVQIDLKCPSNILLNNIF